MNNYLLPNNSDIEDKVFYWKLKADFYRYKCECALGQELEETCAKAEECYLGAFELSKNGLPIYNTERLGLYLNFSKFYYEWKNKINDAYKTAKEAIEGLNDVPVSEVNNKDNAEIIEGLKKNLEIWESEMNNNE